LVKLFDHRLNRYFPKNNIIKFVCYICDMRLVIDDMKSEHLKWLTEMAKTLHFKVVEVELSEDEEDAELVAAMLDVKDEPDATPEEVDEFRKWLRSSE
jgi:hypothetical protein